MHWGHITLTRAFDTLASVILSDGFGLKGCISSFRSELTNFSCAKLLIWFADRATRAHDAIFLFALCNASAFADLLSKPNGSTHHGTGRLVPVSESSSPTSTHLSGTLSRLTAGSGSEIIMVGTRLLAVDEMGTRKLRILANFEQQVIILLFFPLLQLWFSFLYWLLWYISLIVGLHFCLFGFSHKAAKILACSRFG